MGPLLILLGLAALLFGLGNLIRPLGRMRVGTRRQAGLVVVGSLVLMIVGAALIPDGNATETEAGGEATTTGIVSVTSTTVAATTSISIAATATTVSLPSIPEADVVFAPPGPGPSGDPGAAPPAGGEMATVTSITDGDTLDVSLAGGGPDTVRLIGTNSPEPGECFADESSRTLSTLIPVGTEVAMTVDVSDRDQYDRLLRYLWLGGMSVNEEMVRRGAAISRRYPPDTTMAARLDQAQAEAQDRQLGLWEPDACGPDAGTEIVLTMIEADAPGDDNENLNAEYVQLSNRGDIAVDMTDWVLKDESASHRFEFPAGFTLGAGAGLTIFTGCGPDSATSLHWCNVGGAVWNNDGDTAFLLDHNGNIVHSLPTMAPTTTTPAAATTLAPISGGGGDDCDPSYPDVCIPPPPPDLDCGDIQPRRFRVVGSDPHGFDGEGDGIGCES
jgi:micrococcal nuclease